MPRKTRTHTRSLAALAVTVVAATALLVAGAAQAGTPATHEVRSSRYVATVDQTSGLNSQGVPGGLGRRGTLHADLRTARHPKGAVVGTVELELQTTSTHYPSTILELGTIRLRHTTLAVAGVQTEGTSDSPLAITGATGNHVGGQGTVTIRDDGDLIVRWAHARA